MPKPRAPDASLLRYCEPLIGDACEGDACTAAPALAVDTINRDRHIACQRKDNGLVDYVRGLIAEGWLEATEEGAPPGR